MSRFLASYQNKSGFTLLEVLIVILVIGVLSATAVGNYYSVIQDARIKSVYNRVETFLKANQSKAKLRKLEIKLVYNENAKSFQDQTSTNNFIKVPELCQQNIPKLIEIDKSGDFKIAGQKSDKLELSINLPGNRVATISINL